MCRFVVGWNVWSIDLRCGCASSEWMDGMFINLYCVVSDIQHPSHAHMWRQEYTDGSEIAIESESRTEERSVGGGCTPWLWICGVNQAVFVAR